MSDSVSPEQEALVELESVIGRVTEELAGWRRRALKAEADRSALGEDHDAVATRERIRDLEVRNVDLEARLAGARDRTELLLSRLRFLEEQVALGEPVR